MEDKAFSLLNTLIMLYNLSDYIPASHLDKICSELTYTLLIQKKLQN